MTLWYWGSAFLFLGTLALIARLHIDFTIPKQNDHDQVIKKNLLTTSIVLFAVGLVLMALTLFKQ